MPHIEDMSGTSKTSCWSKQTNQRPPEDAIKDGILMQEEWVGAVVELCTPEYELNE